MRFISISRLHSNECEEKIAMNRAIKSLIVIIALVLLASIGDAITVEQMQQATEPVRMGKNSYKNFFKFLILNFKKKVCIQKSKVSETSLENMRLKKLDDSKELKCYVNCVLEMMQLVSAIQKLHVIFVHLKISFNR